MPEQDRTHFSVKAIRQHYGNRASVSVIREQSHVSRDESIDLSLTLDEAAQLRVGSTYTLEFIPVPSDGDGGTDG